MASGVYKGLTIELNAKTTALSTALRQSEREAKSLQKEMKQVQKALSFDDSNTAAYNRQINLLEQSIESATEKLNRLQQAQAKYGQGGMSTDAWTKLQFEIEKTTADIERYQAQITAMVTEQAAADSALGKAGARLTEVGEKLDPIGQKMQSVGRTMTTHVTLPIVAAGTATIKAATDIDTALTGVRKTVDGTEQQYQQLKEAAIEFSKTNAVSAEQVLNAQALGAQLGFTIDELDEFSRVATGMEIATDMGLEDAASEMAQFANITNMAHSDISRYASAIVNVGNNMATTESQVSHMAQRIAAAGTQVRMSQADILGWSGVMSSLGVEAEAGGTAFSQFVSSIDAAVATGNDDLQAFADIAGMTAEEFSQAWRTSSTDTLQAILKGVAGADNMTVALEKMGVTGQRQSDVLKRLAGNTELVANGLQIANKGWRDNTALSNEVANRNESLAAKFEMLKNRVIAVAEEVGKPLADAMLAAIDAAEPLFEAIENGAKAFADMDESEQRAIIQTVAIIAALGPALSVFGKVTSSVSVLGGAMSTLSKYLATAQVAMGKGIPAGASQAASSVAQMGAKMKLASAAAGGLQAAAVALAVAGIAVCAKAIADTVEDVQNFEKSTRGLEEASKGLDSAFQQQGESASAAADGLYHYGDAVREVSDKQAALAEKISETFSDTNADAALVQSYVDKIVELQKGFNGSADSVAEMQALLDGYNSVTGDSVTLIDGQTGALNVSTETLLSNADAWIANARAQAAQELYQESFKNQLDIELKLKDATDRVAEATAHYNEVQGQNAEIVNDASEELRAAQAEADALKRQYDSASIATKNLEDATIREKRAASEATNVASRFKNSLNDLEGSTRSLDRTADMLGVGVDDLANRMAQGGISARDFSRVGSDAFARLYREADGDMSKIAASVRSVDGMRATVDVNVNDNASWQLSDIANAAWSIPRNIGINVQSAFSGWFAQGGISLNAIKKIPRHADGGIAGIVTGPTLTNIGWTGEAGAEAIVPLTNKRYVRPFAQAIANEMAGGSPSKNVTNNINITMPGMVVREEADIDKISDRLSSRISRETRSRL